MTRPHYIATKVGDEYTLIRVDPANRATCAVEAAAGMIGALVGIARRSFPGLVLAIAGGMLIYRGVTGVNPLNRLLRFRRDRNGDPHLSPSYQRDDVHQAGQMPSDDVDEASMESFPASDPPARSGGS